MIRAATVSDLDEIVILEEKVLKHSLGISFLRQELIDNPASSIYVYELNKRIIGYIGYRLTDLYGEMLNLVVDIEYQNQGIGTKLMTFIINELYASGAESLVLEVRKSNLKAIKFYEKFGAYRINTLTNYYEGSEDALVMIMEVKKYDNFIS